MTAKCFMTTRVTRPTFECDSCHKDFPCTRRVDGFYYTYNGHHFSINPVGNYRKSPDIPERIERPMGAGEPGDVQ